MEQARCSLLFHCTFIEESPQPDSSSCNTHSCAALRPRHVLVIGSGYGFSVVSLGLCLRDSCLVCTMFTLPSCPCNRGRSCYGTMRSSAEVNETAFPLRRPAEVAAAPTRPLGHVLIVE